MSIEIPVLNRWIAPALLLLGMLGSCAGGEAQPGSPPNRSVRLQLKWYHQFQFAGYYAAQAQGYYREEGLEVRIIEGDAQHPPIQEVLAGRADFSVSDADVLRAYLEGKPLVVLAAIFQHSPYILMTRADSGLRTPTDLRGRTIMLSDEQGIVQLKAMFRREGMSLKDVHVVPHQWNNDLLINRQVDAISAYSTVEPFQLKAKGVEPAMIRAMDYGVDFYGDTLFTTRAEVERHPVQVAGFRRASLRGWEYAMAHPEEIIDLILKLPGVQERGLSREMLRYEAEAMRQLILPGLVDIGHMNPGRWQAIARIYADMGLVGRTPSERQLEGFIFNPAGRSHDTWIEPLLWGLGTAILVACGVLAWNLQLRRSVARRTAALQRVEQQLGNHVENSPLAVIEWDHQFRVTRWTGQAEQVFGWKTSEVAGKRPTEWRFVHGEDIALAEQVMARLASGLEQRNVIHNRNYRKDGAVVDCEWYNSSSLDQDGKVRSILSLALDVTGRKQVERALAHERAFLEAVLQACPAGIIAANADGRLVRMNPANERLWGIAPFSQSVEEYRQWKGWWADGSDRQGRLIEPQEWAMARALRGEVCPGDIVEIEPFGAPGVRRTMINSGAPVRGANGEILGAVVVQWDITSLKETEKTLRASEEAAEAANRAKSQFLASMSHELRTPMNAILGMTDLALNLPGLPAQGRDFLKTAKESADQLLELLNEILDFSRIEAGRFELEYSAFNLVETVEQVIRTLGVRAYEKGLELVYELAEDLPRQVLGDAMRLRQVLTNLVGNAIKFTHHGEIVVQIEVERQEAERIYLRFAVKDSGIGIAPEHLEKIFAPFTQADASTTRHYGGSGLGLAISQRLVQLMGGRLWVESQVGQGSTFCFTVVLRCSAEASAKAELGGPRAEALCGLPVLVVSHSHAQQRMLQQILASWSLRPEAVDDVPTALTRIHQAVAEGRNFRLVLADAVLPTLNGFMLAEWLRKDPRLAGPVVLMLSAADRQHYPDQCQAPERWCVDKPLTQSRLFDTMIKALGLDLSVMTPAGTAAERDKPHLPSRLLHVLLAEDTPANQKLVQHVLENRGHQLTVVPNGLIALSAVERQSFDVILMDVQMPEMDGLEATRKIRLLPDRAKAQLPVIAMTAHALKGDMEKCLAAGMNAYLSKPIKAQELITLVEHWGHGNGSVLASH